MPLSRLLLPLCGLLLALAVTSASATAPLYGDGEVRISVWKDATAMSRYPQQMRCKDRGGSLVPMVTDAVYTLVVDALDSASIQQTFCNMGASTILSSAECTTATASLECVWFWDEGRYAGAENAVSFYKGNRDPSALSGAEMIGTAVSNHWGSSSSTARCPCEKMQRYGAIVRRNGGAPFWSDTGLSTFSYLTVGLSYYRIICAIEQSTTTTTTTTTLPPTLTTLPSTMTTTAEPSEESNGVNVPLVVGLSVVVAFVLIVTIVIIVSLVCCGGCSCLAGASGAASASSTLSASRRESLSRGNSFNSRGSSLSSRRTSSNSRRSSVKSRGSSLNLGSRDTGSRGRSSFHENESRRKSSRRRSSSARSFEDDVIPWRNDK